MKHYLPDLVHALLSYKGWAANQIALEYCHRKKNNPYSAIFWVDPRMEASVKEGFQAIFEQIKKPAGVVSDIQARVAIVLRMFSSWPVRWLLVIDNYDDPNAFPKIADLIPQGELGAILVTSRHGILVGIQAPMAASRVDTLA